MVLVFMDTSNPNLVVPSLVSPQNFGCIPAAEVSETLGRTTRRALAPKINKKYTIPPQ